MFPVRAPAFPHPALPPGEKGGSPPKAYGLGPKA